MKNEIVVLVEEGIGLLNRKHLKSSLEVLRDAHGRARQPWERALCAYQLGALHWGELGDGVEARRLFHETVEAANRIPSDIYRVHLRQLEPNACENLMLLSLSYDEYESWAERLRVLQSDSDILRGQLPMIREQQELGHPWSDVMLMIATSYYNRHDPARDVGRYGAAKSVFHLILVNRRVLRLPRTDWKSAATEYAKLVMRISADCARTLERHAQPSASDPVEFTFIIENAIVFVAEYLADNPRDNDVKEDLDTLQRGLKLFREEFALRIATDADAESAVAMTDHPVDRQLRIKPFLIEAKKLLANSQYRDLIHLCIQILEKNSALSVKYGFSKGDHMAEVFSFRAFALQELGDLEGAFNDFSSAIVRDSSYVTCYRERGLLLVRFLAAGKQPACCPFGLQEQADKDFAVYLKYFPERAEDLAMLIGTTREGDSGGIRTATRGDKRSSVHKPWWKFWV